MQLLAKGSWSTVSTVDLVLSSYSSTFRHLKFFFSNITVSAAAAELRVRTSTNGGSSFDSGASDYAFCVERIGSTFDETGDQNAATTGMLIGTQNTGNGAANFELILCSRTETKNVGIMHNGSYRTDQHWTFIGSGKRQTDADVDAIRLFPDTGTFSGNYSIYGIR